MTQAELVQAAGQKADEYRKRGFHCSESVLRALAEVFQVELGEDLERASTVFRGGGGGYGDRCGAVTGGAMLLSLLFGEKQDAASEALRRQVVEQMQRRFIEKVGSNLCSLIKPVAQMQWSSDQSCSITYQVGAETAVEVILEQERQSPGSMKRYLPLLDQVDGAALA